VALAALYGTDTQERIIALAQYIVDAERPDLAEAAIIVEDAFQRRGLGTLLLRRLVEYACTHGVSHFIAHVHHSNAQIVRFIQRSGLKVERSLEAGVWEFKICLGPLPATNHAT
jgi:GNAT superfamily N-acetyltransferase